MDFFCSTGGGGCTAGGGVTTLTVVEAVCTPPGPVAVSVNVVELVGDTGELPVACTVPTPWLIATLEAVPDTSHRNMEDSPL
jgi:hypothetical protein